jgi:hypothetical protein
MSKKTFKVQELLDQVNLSLASYSERNEISGMISILEFVLHQTGNYAGFRYLEQHEVPFDQKPGIRHELDDKFIDTDCFRRSYY